MHMKSDTDDKTIIGRAEIVTFPELSPQEVHARIDTGAQTSAIWVSSALIENGKLTVVFFGQDHPFHSGKKVVFDEFTQTIVASSSGHTELRFKVKLLVCIGGRKIRARFTLADRSSQAYPVLIGRNVLRGKFVVDVKLGTPLNEAEKARSRKLQAKLEDRN